MKEELDQEPLWKLSICLGEIENRLVDLKLQGTVSESNKGNKGGRIFSRLRQTRNDLRRAILNKLIEWNKSPENFMNDEKEGITYSDALRFREEQQ